MKFKSASYRRNGSGKVEMTIEVIDQLPFCARCGTDGGKFVRRISITAKDAADIFGAILGAFGLKVGR